MKKVFTNKDSISDLEHLSDFLDSKYKLPGGIGIGWDAIIGLIPGIGDLITSSLSFYILFRATLLGATPFVLAKMCLNILIDNVLNFFPIIGNLFDIFWKSNRKNVRLLRNHLEDPASTSRRAKISVLLSLILISLFALCVFAMILWGMYLFFVFITEVLAASNSVLVDD